MLKPMKTARLKTVGLSLRFARGIMERAASVGSYDLSESELVFAMGAAREKDDLISILELLDEVLDLIKRGFDRHTNVLTTRIINNIGITLRRGGFSREYPKTLNIYNKIFSAAFGKTENFNLSEYHGEIHKQLTILGAEQTKQTRIGRRGNTTRFDRSLKIFGTVSERRGFTLNTLNSGVLRITARNPELLKLIRTDKSFMELSLKNIENLRRRTERTVMVRRFFDALTEEQIRLLDRVVVNENLFSELREKSDGYHELKFLLENSSEKSLSEFFKTLKQITEEQSALRLERNYFDSVEKMKEFFIGAERGEIQRLINELERDGLYRGEVRTLSEALRIYEVETEKRRVADEKITELYRNAEDALKRRLSEKNFSEERFIEALGASRELKKFFTDYAWKNYRSDETIKRYAEYMKNAVSISGDKTYGSEQAASRVETHVLQESAASDVYGDLRVSSVGSAHGSRMIYDNAQISDNIGIPNNSKISEENRTAAYSMKLIDRMTKESFADFLINSGELKLKFSESVKNSFLHSSSDIIAAFAEYLVNSVRGDSFDYYSRQVRSLAEKTENILYYESYGIEDKTAKVFSLISDVWNENSSQLSELYADFTQSRADRDEILKLYSQIPKNNYIAVSEFLGAAAQGDEYFIKLSDDFLKQSDIILSNIGGISENIGYTFYDALNNMSENTLSLLEPLVGMYGSNNVFGGNVNYVNTAVNGTSESGDVIGGDNISVKENDSAEYNTLVKQTSALVVSAAFAEYLSSTVLGDSSAHYNERMHTLAERIKDILHSEHSDIRERSAEAFALIYSEQNYNYRQLSELYADFTQSRADRDEILKLYSQIPKNNYIAVSEFLGAARGGTNLLSLDRELSKQSEKLFERMSKESKTELKHMINETAALTATEDGLVFAEKTSGIRAILPSGLSVSNRFERRVYNITQNGKSIVTDKKFYNALTAFNGGEAYNMSDSTMSTVILELGYPVLTPREYFFTWEDGSVTRFNRTAANKTHIRTNSFFERHSAAALTFSERISERLSAANQRSDSNTAVELLYTDEYFESGGGANTAVNYVLPATVPSGSEEVSEKLGNIRGAIESINTEIDGIKRREDELSREFVTKSEHKVFERELKSSIERDIYLAGKRHGIY